MLSDLSYMTKAWDILIDFKIHYHEKNLEVYLNQSSENSEANQKIHATYYLKSHLRWINFVHGSYQIKISGNTNLESFFNIIKDHYDIKISINGKLSYHRINLQYIIDHNIGSKDQIHGEVRFKRKNYAYYLNVSLKQQNIDVTATIKTRKNPNLSFDFSIVSKKLHPASFRVKLDETDDKKVLKAELKIQNTQVAGCNFQYMFRSVEELLIIAKGKIHQNAFEIDLINNKKLKQLFTSLSIEGLSILKGNYEVKTIQKHLYHIAEFSSRYSFLHNFNIYIDQYENSYGNITHFTANINDFNSSGSITSLLESDSKFLTKISFQSNLKVINNFEAKFHINEFNGNYQNEYFCKLNEKHIKLLVIKESKETKIIAGGPWGNVSLSFEQHLSDSKFDLRVEFVDNQDKLSKASIKLHRDGNLLKGRITMKAPFTEEFETVVEINPNDKKLLSFIKGLQTSQLYANLESQILNNSDGIGIILSFTSLWTDNLNIKANIYGILELTTRDNSNPVNILLKQEVKYGQLDILSSEISLLSTDSMKSLKLWLTSIYSNSIDLELTYQYEAEKRMLKYKLKFDDILHSYIQGSYSENDSHKLEIDLKMKFLNWNDSKIEILVPDTKDKITLIITIGAETLDLQGNYISTETGLSCGVIIHSAFEKLPNIDIMITINFLEKEIKASLSSSDNSSFAEIYGKMFQDGADFNLKVFIPLISVDSHNIIGKLRYSSLFYDLFLEFNKEKLHVLAEIKEDQININILTPFINYESIKITSKYNENGNSPFFIKINENFCNGTFNLNSTYLRLNVQSSINLIESISITLNWNEKYALRLDYKELVNLNIEYSSINKVTLDLQIKMFGKELTFNHGHDLEHTLSFNTSIFIKKFHQKYMFKILVKSSEVTIHAKTPFSESIVIKCNFDLKNMKFKLANDIKNLLTCEFGIDLVEAWTGKYHLLFHSDFLNWKKISIVSDYSLLSSNKIFDFKASYGNKVFMGCLQKNSKFGPSPCYLGHRPVIPNYQMFQKKINVGTFDFGFRNAPPIDEENFVLFL